MKKPVKYAFIFSFLLMIFMGRSERAFSQDADYKAYTLFLYNFMKYIEWPDATGDFVIGVMGDSPINKELITLSETKKAKGRKIVVKVISTPEEAAGCSMVYIPSFKSSMLKLVFEKTKNKPVLIVGKREGLAKKGAGISFVIDDDDALKFDMNKSVLDSQSLKVANLLVQLAILVG